MSEAAPRAATQGMFGRGPAMRLLAGRSLRTRLILLVFVGIVPFLSFALARQYYDYQDDRANAGLRALDLARSLTLVVEREIQTRIAILQVLALSPTLQNGDLAAFRSRAEAVIAQQFPGSTMLLLREDGQHVMNTAAPAGAALPVGRNLDLLRRTIATRLPAVSDLFFGVLLRRSVISVQVPVFGDDGRVIYALSLNPPLDGFADIIRRQQPPQGWVVSLFDGAAVILARTPNLEQSIGQKASSSFRDHLLGSSEGIVDSLSREGVPLVSAFKRASSFGWAVGVGVPQAEVIGPALDELYRTLAAGGTLLAVGLLLANLVAGTISSPIASLRRLATTTDNRRFDDAPPTGLPEVDDVIAAFRVAEQRQQLSESVASHNEERFRLVFDTAVHGMILIDDRGTIAMFNPACERLFGYRPDEVVGRNVKILMPAPFHEEHDGYLRNYLETGRPKVIGIGREVVGRRKDGSTFPMHLSVGECRQDNRPFFVGIINDITERQKTEAQLRQAQKMEAVGQLSGGIAHDFNNILAVVIGNLDQLMDVLNAPREARRGGDNVETLCTEALNGALRGAELVRRLLAFSRNQPLQPRVLDLGKVVHDLEPLLWRSLGERIVVETQLREKLWPVSADRAQIENAILNLAINARDAMPDGGRLTIICANTTLDTDAGAAIEIAPGDYVSLSVADTGTGIPDDIMKKVFEPFFTTKEVGKGSGLGLSMVYGFARQSGGEVKIYSEPGVGTEVRLYLPRDRSAAAADESPAVEDEASLPTGTERILVVEDKPDVRDIVCRMLDSLGYAVMHSEDGTAALATLDGGAKPDLLFTDIVMPGHLSGIDVAHAARRRFPELPIVFTSGFSNPETVHREALALGAALITKPYRKADLAKLLRTSLDRRGSNASAS